MRKFLLSAQIMDNNAASGPTHSLSSHAYRGLIGGIGVQGLLPIAWTGRHPWSHVWLHRLQLWPEKQPVNCPSSSTPVFTHDCRGFKSRLLGCWTAQDIGRTYDSGSQGPDRGCSSGGRGAPVNHTLDTQPPESESLKPKS